MSWSPFTSTPPWVASLAMRGACNIVAPMVKFIASRASARKKKPKVGQKQHRVRRRGHLDHPRAWEKCRRRTGPETTGDANTSQTAYTDTLGVHMGGLISSSRWGYENSSTPPVSCATMTHRDQGLTYDSAARTLSTRANPLHRCGRPHDADPARARTLPSKNVARRMHLTAEQLGTLTAECSKHGELILGTVGLRWDEGYRPQVGDLNFVRHRATIKRNAVWVGKDLISIALRLTRRVP